MDNVSSIAELLAISWQYLSRLLSFINIRHEGFAIIKKRWGKPIKVYDLSERWCWKWPIAERFDVVDIRKQIIYLNAHSVKNNDECYILPMNTTIDAQAEFRVVNPNIIYKISDDIVKYDENNYTTTESYIDNTVQLLISKMIAHNPMRELTNANIQDKLNEELKIYNRNRPTGFCKNFDFDVSDGLIIERVVIVSFDNNLSLRNTE